MSIEKDMTPRGLSLTRRALLHAVTGTVVGVSLTRTGLFAGSAVAQEALPTRGGTLKLNMNGDPPNFDPMGNTTSWLITTIGPCYNGLLQYDPLDPDTIIGDLAERWDMADDGKSYTFHLLRGVTFHDGIPLTSEDVKFTFDTMRNPPEGYVSTRKSDLSLVEEIKVLDEHTVVFVLSAPSPSFVTQLATGWMIVQPKHILEKGPMTDTVVGTGPFKFGQYARGVSVELIRNEKYHIPDRPFLDGIQVFIIPEAGSALAFFKSGQLDCYEYMPNDVARQVQATMGESIALQTAPSTGFLSVTYNTKRKPWDDIRVRQAASLAIDREALKQIQFRGDAVLSGFSFPGFWALSDDERAKIAGYGPKQEPDAIERARKLLAEAGYADGFDTKILTRRIERFEPFGVFLKDQWQRIGIRATVDLQETAVFNESIKRLDFDVNAGGGGLPLDDPNATFGPMTCGDTRNKSQICNATFDELYLQQSLELDRDKRRAIVNEMERIALSDYGVYHMFFTIRFQGAHKNVRDYLLHSNPDNNKRMQHVWLAKV